MVKQHCVLNNLSKKTKLIKAYTKSNSTLTIKPTRDDFIDPYYQAIRESIGELSRWMWWCHADYSKTDVTKWITSCSANWKNGIEYNFTIFDNNNQLVLGACSLNRIDHENRLANMGYWVRTSKTRQGIATSAGLLLTEFGFNELNLNRIGIVTSVLNRASQRVVEKIGGKKEGFLRNRLFIHGKSYDALGYSLVPEDFE